MSDSAMAWKRTLGEIASSASDSHVVVATRSSDVVGLIMGSMQPSACGEIDALYVAPRSQRSGVGGRLLSTSLGVLRNDGVDEVEVSVLAANAPARRFYEHNGATVVRSVEIEEDAERLPGVIYQWAFTR